MTIPDTTRQSGSHVLVGVVLAGLAMSVGWGIRGDYGHEAGAMIPGALFGLAICLASGRDDWWRRAGIMGMAGAVGWAFGGQMSYGRIIGYTAGSSLLNVYYGYACLFLVGGLWAGIGSAILALSVTRPRAYLEQFVRPLVVLSVVWLVMGLAGWTEQLVGRWYGHDTDWVGASSALVVAAVCAVVFARDRGACTFIAVLAIGWWVGYLILTVLLGLHMTPPRSDNWAGCTGLFVALILFWRRQKDRTAVTLAGYGFLFGGLGFVLGDFANMLGRAQWGPIGRYGALQGLDYWKWMEQSFGLIMGLGVGTIVLRRVAPRLSAPADDTDRTRLSVVSLAFLLVAMMWLNLHKNVLNWAKGRHIPEDLFGVSSAQWLVAVGVLVSAAIMVAIVRHGRGRLPLAPAQDVGRAQLLFLLVLWMAVLGALTQALPRMNGKGVFLVHVSFWATAGVCSLIVVSLGGRPRPAPAEPLIAADASWRPRRGFWIALCLVPLLLLAVAYLTVASHDRELPGSRLRFSVQAGDAGPS